MNNELSDHSPQHLCYYYYHIMYVVSITHSQNLKKVYSTKQYKKQLNIQDHTKKQELVSRDVITDKMHPYTLFHGNLFLENML